MLTPDKTGWRFRILTVAVAIGLAAALYHGVQSCRETEEDRVRAVIDAIEEGAEARKVGDIVEHISEAYRDKDGLTKAELRLFLMREFLVNKEGVTIQRIGSTGVTLRGPAKNRRSATVAFRAVLVEGGSLAGILRDGEAWDFEVDLRKEEGAWRVESHRRAPAR